MLDSHVLYGAPFHTGPLPARYIQPFLSPSPLLFLHLFVLIFLSWKKKWDGKPRPSLGRVRTSSFEVHAFLSRCVTLIYAGALTLWEQRRPPLVLGRPLTSSLQLSSISKPKHLCLRSNVGHSAAGLGQRASSHPAAGHANFRTMLNTGQGVVLISFYRDHVVFLTAPQTAEAARADSKASKLSVRDFWTHQKEIYSANKSFTIGGKLWSETPQQHWFFGEMPWKKQFKVPYFLRDVSLKIC